jgi:hypothetical protein
MQYVSPEASDTLKNTIIVRFIRRFDTSDSSKSI